MQSSNMLIFCLKYSLQIKAAKVHPNYNYDSIQNDVAIMKLADKVKISDFIAPICFPTSDMSNMQVQGAGSV